MKKQPKKAVLVVKIALALAALAVLLWAGYRLILLGASAVMGYGGMDAAGADPMYAEEAELMTMPPELLETNTGEAVTQDQSANWDITVHTPVGMTAEELIEQEKNKERESADNG